MGLMDFSVVQITRGAIDFVVSFAYQFGEFVLFIKKDHPIKRTMLVFQLSRNAIVYIHIKPVFETRFEWHCETIVK